MTKKEYLQQVCKQCKGNASCTKLTFHSPEEHACPKVLDVASKGWDAAEAALKEKAEVLYHEGKIDGYALNLLFDWQHPVDAGRQMAKKPNRK